MRPFVILTAELEKRAQTFEIKCYRRLLNISYNDHTVTMSPMRLFAERSKQSSENMTNTLVKITETGVILFIIRPFKMKLYRLQIGNWGDSNYHITH